MNVLDHARRYVGGGISVIPVRADGSKRPSCETWKPYQSQIATDAELQGWFGNCAVRGMAGVGGRVSGHLEVIDVDDSDLVAPFMEAVEHEAPGLLEKICHHETPRPGSQFAFRCSEVVTPGNMKLAQTEPRPVFNEDTGEPEIDQKTGKQRMAPKTLIETRGEGGYFLLPGCPAKCHKTGRLYRHVGGPALHELGEISAAERDVLFRVARQFNLYVDDDDAQHGQVDSGFRREDLDVNREAADFVDARRGQRPGDDFNQHATWETVLEPHGWQKDKTVGGLTHWTRPGKNSGTSATTGAVSKQGNDLLCVFSTNADPFQGANGAKCCTSYSKFAAYAVLNHGGDFEAATKALAAEGYGDQQWSDGRQQSASDDRPAILIEPDEHLVTEAAVKALANAPDVFQRANVLVHVLRDEAKPSFLKRPKDSPRIEKIPAPRLREILSREASWWKYNADGERKRHRVDGECVKQVDARGYWPGVRPLEGIIEAPALRPDGSIITAAGFDALTGLLHEPNVSLPPMKPDLTQHDAHAAALELLDIVCDFPFAEPEHRSAWLAGVLTPFARHAFEGCVPLFLIDKNVRGAGGGLLANTIGIITTGRDMTVMAAATDDAEWRKKITAIAVEALPTVLIDNIAGRFGWPSLDAALTSTTWSDRLLKENRNAKARLQTIWYATGNNIALQADTSRRCLHIRIETSDETPEERTGFVHANLKAHVLRNRGELVRAALTVLRAYFMAGCPSMGLTEWGSFEQWSRLIRGAIVWLGLPDPGATRRELSKQSDVESNAAATLILVWHSTYGDQRHTAAEAIDDARRADPTGRTPDERFTALRNAILDVAGQRSGDLPTSRTLAMKLHHLRKRVIGGRQFDCVEREGTKHWFVKQA